MLIAITGGIGSGKSVVSDVLRHMGFHVYDSDSNARLIMDSSPMIKRRIASEIHESAIVNNVIDRKRLADIVFNDADLLNTLNSIVHSAVRDDITEWSRDKEIAFIETAILYESKIDKMVDEVWNVSAPLEIRIDRVMKRNNMSRDDVRARIDRQQSYEPEVMHHNVKEIINDNINPILPRIEELILRIH